MVCLLDISARLAIIVFYVKIVKFDKIIAGRRTFIVNALSRGISPNVVMKWTGHASYSSMKPYIDIVDSIKASEMAKMNFMD